MFKKFFILFLFVFFFFSNETLAAKLLRVTPAGEEVTERSQIVFQFDQPMTELGNMDRQASEIPIEITPAVNCHWRWLNTTALACQLGDDSLLKPASRYDIKVGKDIKALDGSELNKASAYFIETQRPEILPEDSRFFENTAPQKPKWRISFRMPVKKESVEKRISYSVAGKEIDAKVSSEDCRWGGKDCYSRYYIEPVQYLGINTPYEIRYKKGFAEYDGGALLSKREGVLGKGKTLPVFGIEGIFCHDMNYTRKLYPPDAMKNQEAVCRFDSTAYIRFSDNIPHEKVSELVIVSPQAKISERYYADKDVYLGQLKPGTTYTVKVSPEISDVWGNTLGQETILTFRTYDDVPDLYNPYLAAVLEAAEKTDVYSYATNLTSAEVKYKGFTASEDVAGTHVLRGIDPDLKNIRYPVSSDIRKLLNDKTGFLFASYKTTPSLSSNNIYVSVSPWQILVKFGHYSSLVWVVDMKTGKPVKDAQIELYKQKISEPTAKPNDVLAKSKTDKKGLAFLPGYAEFDKDGEWLKKWGADDEFFFVKAEKGDEIGVIPLSNSFAVSSRFLSDGEVDTVYGISPEMYLRAWGVTAQGVYRQGENVQYKIYVREEHEKTLVSAPQETYDLEVIDPLGKKILERSGITLSEYGALEGEFKLPDQTASGWYTFHLKYKEKNLTPLKFLVSDFVPSPFKVTTEVDSKRFMSGESVKISSYATLFSGGPYASAPARQTIVLSSASFKYKGADLQNKQLNFDKPLQNGEYGDEILLNVNSILDSKGEAHQSFDIPFSPKAYGRLHVETTVSDEGGRSTSGFVSGEYFGVDRLVGIRKTEWMSSVGKPAEFEFVVSSPQHELISGVPVSFSFIYSRYKAVRVKSGGNAYLLSYEREDIPVGECQGTSAKSVQSCSFIPKESGSYKAIATIKDSKGRTHFVQEYFYVDGEEYVAWETKNNRLDIGSDKTEYQIGEKIKLFVKNPMPGAVALVTVERYGIIHSFVQEMKKSTATIEIPVSKDFFPGVYVSITLFSQRVDKPIEGNVDLGKPTEWGGYVKIPITDTSKRISVKAVPEKKVYRPGEKAKISIKADLPKRQKGKMEAAVVVLDEAVLALLPTGTAAYDPYKGFYSLNELDVRTYSMLERLVGRQKVEKKGANQGGDGGSDFAMRDIFKFVGYWNPSVPLDKKGRGEFEMVLPDNLTGWRVIVLAVTETDLMGMGEARFEVNKPLEIRPLLPNQVRTTDIFVPGVSLLNRSKEVQEITVAMTASGNLAAPQNSSQLIILQPFERKGVFFETITASLPPEKAEGQIQLKFSAKAGDETDGLVQNLPVLNLTTMQTAAEYGSTSDETVSTPIEIAKDVGVYGGSLEMSVSPTALGGLDKVVEYMKKYPYSCWEQQISQALVAASYLRIQDSFSSKDLWPDADDFVKKTIEKASNYQAPNGGMAYFEPKNNYVSPYLTAYTSYAFVQLKAMGYDIPVSVEEQMQEYLYRIFRETDSSISDKVLRTTRLMSLPFLTSRSGNLVVSCDYDTFERDLPMMSVFDKALLLNALKPLKSQQQLADKVQESLMGMMNVTSGNILFQNGSIGPWWYALLSSPARDNCAVLTALTAGGVSEKNADIPEKLFHAVNGLRRKDGTWSNTQANYFCMNAARSYAEAYESEPVRMSVVGSLGTKEVLKTEFASKSEPSVSEKIPLTADDVGRKTSVSYTKTGTGRYYYKTLLSYPAMDGEARLAGMEVVRSYAVERWGEFVPVDEGAELKKGDLVRVTLQVMNPAPRTFVAMIDPVPGGLEPVNRELATASSFDEAKAHANGLESFWSGFYFREIGHNAVKFYAETLQRGTFELSYVAQVIADGSFKAFPAKVEAMYEPDIFGLSRAESITIGSPQAIFTPLPDSGQGVSPEDILEDSLPGVMPEQPPVPDEDFPIQKEQEEGSARDKSLIEQLKQKVKDFTDQDTPDFSSEEEDEDVEPEVPLSGAVPEKTQAVQEVSSSVAESKAI